MEHTSLTLRRDGVDLCAEVAGSGGVPLVFVPGGSCDWWSFHRQLEHFSASHRCVSLDLRGHGRSAKPEQDYTIAGYADDVAWIIGELGLDRPVVIGHSLGGAVALQLAADHPGVARAVVLDDPAPVTDNRAGFQQMLDGFVSHGVDATRRRAFRNFFLAGFDEALLAEICDRAAQTPDRVFTSEIESLRDWDGAAAAARCTVPLLHIAAAQPTCPPAALVAAAPHTVTGQTVGAGHFNMLEVPDQVNAMIEQFLRRYVAAGTPDGQDGLDAVIARSREAVGGVIRGDASLIHALYDDAEDITLGNPFGPFVRGRRAVLDTTAAAAARYRDGELGRFDTVARHVSGELACVVETERFRARLGDGAEPAELALRVTSLYRRTDRGWRLVHRHADPITTARGAESLLG